MNGKSAADGRYIVGMGEVLWDLLPEGRKIGGAPANFAYHVSQFGFPGRVASAVGDDEPGAEILRDFARKGLGGVIETVPWPTGSVRVALDAAGVPRYEIREDVAWDNIPFTFRLEELARRTRAVCFGSLAQRGAVSRRTIARFLDAMPAGPDCYRVFDINLRQEFYSEEVVRDSLRRCDVLKINDEELAIVGRMFGCPELGAEGMCRKLLSEYGLRMLILTCGVDGSYVFTPDGRSEAETPRVAAVDTVGAGDSFTASFLAGILAGRTVREAHLLAADVSAYVCTQHGAMPRLPETLIRRIR